MKDKNWAVDTPENLEEWIDFLWVREPARNKNDTKAFRVHQLIELRKFLSEEVKEK